MSSFTTDAEGKKVVLTNFAATTVLETLCHQSHVISTLKHLKTLIIEHKNMRNH